MRSHARITLNGLTLLLEDLKSANGTYVNNTRVEKATLKVGDIVRFGADPTCSYVVRPRGAEAGGHAHRYSKPEAAQHC